MTFSLALTGTVVGSFTLLLFAWNFWLSWPRMKVTLEVGAWDPPDLLSTTCSDIDGQDWKSVKQKYPLPIIVVKAFNSGRSSAYISSWNARIESDPGDSIIDPEQRRSLDMKKINPHVPCWIQPGEPLDLVVDLGDGLMIAVTRKLDHPKVYGSITIGSGKEIISRNHIDLEEFVHSFYGTDDPQHEETLTQAPLADQLK